MGQRDTECVYSTVEENCSVYQVGILAIRRNYVIRGKERRRNGTRTSYKGNKKSKHMKDERKLLINKVVPGHTVRVFRESRGTAPVMLKLRSRWS